MSLSSKTLIAAGLAALVFGGWFVMRDKPVSPTEPPATATAGDAPATPDIERDRVRPETADETEEPTALPTPVTAPDAGRRLSLHSNVPGARLRVEFFHYGGEPNPPPLDVVADEEGNADVPVPAHPDALARVVVRASADGYADVEVKQRALSEDPIEISLERAFRIDGVVRSSAGGPVAGARLIVQPPTSVDTDAEGRFTLFAATAGPHDVRVSHASHVNSVETVTAGAPPVSIVMEHGLEVSGRVTFPDGTPVSGALVKGRRTGASARSGPGGRYVLSGLSEETFEIQCEGVSGRRSVAPGDVGVDFTVERHALRVDLVDEEGRPFREARLWIASERDGKRGYMFVGDGESLGAHPAWIRSDYDVKISATAPGYTADVTTVTAAGAPVEHVARIVFTRGVPTGSVRLRVRHATTPRLDAVYLSVWDAAMRPVDGWAPQRVALDGDGVVVLGNLPVGSATVRICSSTLGPDVEGFGVEERVPVTVQAAAESDADVTLRDGGRVRLTLRDSDGNVVGTRRVHIVSDDGVGSIARFWSVEQGTKLSSETDGPFPLVLAKPVLPGHYRLTIPRAGSRGSDVDVEIEHRRTVDVEVTVPDVE